MRKLVLVLIAVIAVGPWSWNTPRPAQGVGNTFAFPLSLKGKTNQTDIALPAGSKDIVGKVNDKILASVLRGEILPGHTAPDFATDFLQLDPGGRFYLLFDGRDSWRVATNPFGTGVVTTLNGQTSLQGNFWMAGKVGFPMVGPSADAFAVGKVKFAKGTFNPLKISGTVHFVSKDVGECFTLKFKTVGGPLS
jgi:hypothetical protein